MTTEHLCLKVTVCDQDGKDVVTVSDPLLIPIARHGELVKCPWCGYLDLKPSEYASQLRDEGDLAVTRCKHCDCDFKVILHVRRMYETQTLAPAGVVK